MALTYDQVSGLTHALINESSADNVYGSNPLFVHLYEKGQVVVDGGSTIKLPVSYAALGAAGTFNRYSLLDTTPTDSDSAAEYNYKFYYVHIIVSITELLRNSGKSQAVNLLKSKTRNGLGKMRDQLGTDLCGTNADSAEGLNGLITMIDSTGTVGGIATTDVAAWASDEDTSTTALSLSVMEQSFLDASVGSDEPDICVTTKAVFKKYWSLLTANQQFGPAQVGKGGFRYLLFNGIPVFHDSHMTAKHLFFLNSRWLYLYVHKDANMKVMKIGETPSQAVHTDRILFAGNICTDNRRMFSKFTLLNYT